MKYLVALPTFTATIRQPFSGLQRTGFGPLAASQDDAPPARFATGSGPSMREGILVTGHDAAIAAAPC